MKKEEEVSKFLSLFRSSKSLDTTKEAIVSTARRLYIQRGHNFQKGGKVRSFCRAISSRGKQRHFRGNGRLSKFRIPSRLRQRSNTSLNSSLSLPLRPIYLSSRHPSLPLHTPTDRSHDLFVLIVKTVYLTSNISVSTGKIIEL